jgi:hypothetical protein
MGRSGWRVNVINNPLRRSLCSRAWQVANKGVYVGVCEIEVELESN